MSVKNETRLVTDNPPSGRQSVRVGGLIEYLQENIQKLTPAPVVLDQASHNLNAADHQGRVLVLSKADGQSINMPVATGSGGHYRFIFGTSITSGGTSISAAIGDVFFGTAWFSTDNAGNEVVAFEAVPGATMLAPNGSSTGGVKGDIIDFYDIDENTWAVKYMAQATGTESQPFSVGL